MVDVSYVPGPLTAVTGGQCWVLADATPDSPAVTRLWQQLGNWATTDALLSGLLADGTSAMPGFTLLAAGADGQHRLFCRGTVGATIVSTRAGERETAPERIDGAGLLTWREHVVGDADRIFLGEPPADTALRLPATSGVLLARCVIIDFTDLATRETVSYEPEKPREHPKKTIVFFPDTITVPSPDGDDGHAPDLAVRDLAVPDLAVPDLVVPDLAVPGQVAPAGLSGAPVTPHADFAAPELPAAVPPFSVPEPAGSVNGGAPGGEGEYDFLWGKTQMRTVEEAAVRGAGDGGPVPPVMPAPPLPPSRLWQGPSDPVQPGGMPPGLVPAPPPSDPPAALPAPRGGLIDVPPWLAGPSESASTIKRTDLPEPAGPTTPPDRIGPVVPALICPNGHVNPPGGTSCRRCLAPLPRDPVPVPRPPLGILRLSLGDVISLDRGVVMGRNPRTDVADIAGLDGEERPHIVKLSAADGDVSRTHLSVSLDGWQVLVTDLNSTNGTIVTLPGRDPQQLQPGEPTPIRPGTVVTLAEGIEFRYEVTS